MLLLCALALSAHAGDRLGLEPGDTGRLPDLPDGPEPVVGGEQADEDEWPDAVGIVFYGQYVGCTGVLVAPRVVLTAEHCTDEPISHVLYASTNWAREGELVRVRDVVAHPGGFTGYDIAVVLLEEPIDVPPRTIARDCILDDHLEDGADVAVVGFGSTDEWGEDYNALLNVGYTYVQDADCSASAGCHQSVAPGGELGAGGNGVDACYGDSGGPLYLLTPDGDFLVGLTSRSYSDVTIPCRDGGIYVRPDAVVDWIEEVSGEALARPVCNLPATVRPVEALRVPRGRSERLRVRWSDEDSDGHELVVGVPPEHGAVDLLGDGRIRYTADDDWLGDDDFTLALVDEDADYPAPEVPIEVRVTVVERGVRPWRACGCAASGSPGGGLVLGLLALVLRRRYQSVGR